MKKISKFTNGLIFYYGILQTLHLLALARAGIILWLFNRAPFPILPPPGGWPSHTMPFLFGLAGTDVIGILLGIFFAYHFLIKKSFKPVLGLISLSIFITGALVFGAGTFPTGAWSAHPISYWLMVVLFVPVLPLFMKLLKSVRVHFNAPEND
jgi:hypothetical protein